MDRAMQEAVKIYHDCEKGRKENQNGDGDANPACLFLSKFQVWKDCKPYHIDERICIGFSVRSSGRGPAGRLG